MKQWGTPVPGLDAVDLNAKIAGAFFLYVPDAKVLGGSVGISGLVTGGQECGQLISLIASRCVTGFGDPYFEVDWSRFFGQIRPSHDPGAFPIMEGLAVNLGLGAVIPIGQYDANLKAMNGISIGNKTFDLAPSIAFSPIRAPPFIADGTEFSTKISTGNDYATNQVTGL